MTPTPEQVVAARDWLNGFSPSGWQVRDNTNGVIEVCTAKVAALLATREAAVWERAARVAEDFLSELKFDVGDEIAAAIRREGGK